ncbi:hypothetical protein FH972_023866 [Carpinus fangiana]|uniref:Uncharacterized protein n=1 Tax=Carpinus fangiana TaxID=176857 RepID=A0A5N6KX65_9ROSI|nr:hypothetical protein FH972_023866 [Carpinus fangiana]
MAKKSFSIIRNLIFVVSSTFLATEIRQIAVMDKMDDQDDPKCDLDGDVTFDLEEHGKQEINKTTSTGGSSSN